MTSRGEEPLRLTSQMMPQCFFRARPKGCFLIPMKTALATLIVALAAPMAVSAAPGVPENTMTAIKEACNASVAGNSQATESDEDCIARAVRAYKK